MKKYLSIFLALLMVLSLAALCACSREESADESDNMVDGNSPSVKQDGAEVASTETYYIVQPDADVGENNTYNIEKNEVEIIEYTDGSVTYDGITMEQLNTSQPHEYVPQKLAAGIEVKVVMSLSTLDEQQMVLFNEGYMMACESMGIAYDYSDAAGDSVTQLEQCENYILMEPAALLCCPSEGELYGDLAAQAISNGTYFLMLGSPVDYEISGTKITVQYDFGAAVGKAGVAYLDYAYPDAEAGSIQTAALYSTLNTDQVDYAEGVMSVLEDDNRLNWAYMNDSCTSIEDGYNAAEEAMTMNADIRIFVCGTPSVAIGVNNYLTSLPNVDLSEFACFMRGENETTTELFAVTEAGGDATFRVWGISGGDWMWQNDVQVLVDLLINGEEPPVIRYERIRVKTTFGYEYNSFDDQ